MVWMCGWERCGEVVWVVELVDILLIFIMLIESYIDYFEALYNWENISDQVLLACVNVVQ